MSTPLDQQPAHRNGTNRAEADQSRSLPARLGAAGVGAFFLASVVAGGLDRGYSPVRETISALSATDVRTGWIMIAGFMASAAGLAFTGIALWRRFQEGRAGRTAAVLLVLSGGLAVVAGLARQDCSERLPSCVDYGEARHASTHFWTHQYVSMVMFLLLTIALFTLARALRRSHGLAHLAVPTRLVGAYTVLSVVALVIEPPFLTPYAGLVQRAFIAAVFLWTVAVATLRSRP